MNGRSDECILRKEKKVGHAHSLLEIPVAVVCSFLEEAMKEL